MHCYQNSEPTMVISGSAGCNNNKRLPHCDPSTGTLTAARVATISYSLEPPVGDRYANAITVYNNTWEALRGGYGKINKCQASAISRIGAALMMAIFTNELETSNLALYAQKFTYAIIKHIPYTSMCSGTMDTISAIADAVSGSHVVNVGKDGPGLIPVGSTLVEDYQFELAYKLTLEGLSMSVGYNKCCGHDLGGLFVLGNPCLDPPASFGMYASLITVVAPGVARSAASVSKREPRPVRVRPSTTPKSIDALPALVAGLVVDAPQSGTSSGESTSPPDSSPNSETAIPPVSRD